VTTTEPEGNKATSFVGPPFLYDVFVTYSHGDVKGSDDSPLKRWSQAFAKELESELRSYPELGRQFSIFLDQGPPGASVNPMAGLSDQLRRDVGASAVMALLMSPQYLGSQWCRDERDWWHEAQKKMQIPHDGRIAIARVWPLADKAEWPAILVDGRGNPLVGFSFFDTKRPQPYEWPAPGPDSKGEFRERLLDMAGRIFQELQSLRQRVEARQRQEQDASRLAGQGRSQDEQVVVYLHGRSTDTRAWKSASEKLADSGFTVFPGEPDPVTPDPDKIQELRQSRVATLSACDALLLLGAGDGRAVDADLVVVGRQDRHSARALSNRLLPCALLDTVGLPIATPERRKSARSLQVDWIDGAAQPWMPAIRSWLVEKSASLRGP
jgi:hypothetical protein